MTEGIKNIIIFVVFHILRTSQQQKSLIKIPNLWEKIFGIRKVFSLKKI